MNAIPATVAPATISATAASVKQPSSNGTWVCLGSRRGERGAAQMLHAATNTAGIAYREDHRENDWGVARAPVDERGDRH